MAIQCRFKSSKADFGVGATTSATLFNTVEAELNHFLMAETLCQKFSLKFQFLKTKGFLLDYE